MILCSLFSAMTAICAWICVPVFHMTYTLQTFAVFLTLFTLGGKWGTVSIVIYLLLGTAGLPVFSGFRGGIGALVGVTGGFLWGFVLTGLGYWAFEKLCKPIGVFTGLFLCYGCGCLWYSVYMGNVGVAAAVVQCVVPYVVPDILKIWLALSLSRRLQRFMT